MTSRRSAASQAPLLLAAPAVLALLLILLPMAALLRRTPWSRWSFWQHAESGQVPGVPGNADVNAARNIAYLAAVNQPMVPELPHRPAGCHPVGGSALGASPRLKPGVVDTG